MGSEFQAESTSSPLRVFRHFDNQPTASAAAARAARSSSVSGAVLQEGGAGRSERGGGAATSNTMPLHSALTSLPAYRFLRRVPPLPSRTSSGRCPFLCDPAPVICAQF